MQREFLNRYGSIPDVLLTHIDDPNDESPRHHGFYVNVDRLLDIPEFQTKVVNSVNSLTPKPEIVVVPKHRVGRKLAALISERCALPVHAHSTLRLDLSIEGDAQIAQAISSAGSLLILDDVAFTGKRLQVYNRSLREGKFKVPSEVVFFPLISLPESLVRWGQMARGVISNHPEQKREIRCLYQFVLPHWDRDKCPWCAEAKEVEKLSPLDDDSDSDIRGTRLANVKDGLRGNQWLNIHEAQGVPDFGKQSFILDAGATPMQLLFACASAVQQARIGHETKNRLDPEGFPKATVLDAAVIRDFQNETLVVVALARCLIRDEVDHAFKKHLSEMAINIAEASQHHDLWALRELLISTKRGIALHIDDSTQRLAAFAKAHFDSFAET
jgi:hypothetical protein